MQIYETQWDFGTSRRYLCKSKSRGWAYRQETQRRTLVYEVVRAFGGVRVTCINATRLGRPSSSASRKTRRSAGRDCTALNGPLTPARSSGPFQRHGDFRYNFPIEDSPAAPLKSPLLPFLPPLLGRDETNTFSLARSL